MLANMILGKVCIKWLLLVFPQTFHYQYFVYLIQVNQLTNGAEPTGKQLLLPAFLCDGETLTAKITEAMKRVCPPFYSHSFMSPPQSACGFETLYT